MKLWYVSALEPKKKYAKKQRILSYYAMAESAEEAIELVIMYEGHDEATEGKLSAADTFCKTIGV